MPGPLPLRRAASRALAAALLLAVGACAQGPAGTGTAGAAAGPADDGAAARTAVLAHLSGRAQDVASVTPSILGRTPAAATALLEDVGLSLHLVPFDRRTTITVQWPPAGRPVPLDGVVEGWLGRPPATVASAPTTAPVPVATATPAGPVASAPAAQAVQDPSAAAEVATTDSGTGDVAVAYVLPPHTEGRLRINPRQLPALPVGTELTGQASWYGPGFHGLQTACGGIYDQNGATIAARELRCGTVVRITGPTGLTVEATVTDWGPAEWTGRRFDLSAAVFNAIAPLGAGVVGVRVVTANAPA